MRVFLCEKPSQGKDIARVLGAVQRGNGCYSGAGVVVTWCIGAKSASRLIASEGSASSSTSGASSAVKPTGSSNSKK